MRRWKDTWVRKARESICHKASEDINVKRLEKDIEKLNHVYNLGIKDGNIL